MNIIKTFMNSMGIEFTNLRTGCTLTAVKNKVNGTKVLQFYPETDIKTGDVVVCCQSSERFHIVDIESVPFAKKIDHLNASYQTNQEYENSQISSNPSTVFNIHTANNSVIGTNPVVTYNFGISDMKSLIQEKAPGSHEFDSFLAVLENTLENERCPKGILSRFSDLLAKHAWLSGAVTQLLFSHFFAK